MLSNRFLSHRSRLLAALITNITVIIGGVGFSTFTYANPSEIVLDLPTKIVEGDDRCLILPKKIEQEDQKETSEKRIKTPQEKWAEINWNSREKWIWRELCKGNPVDFTERYPKPNSEKESDEKIELVELDFGDDQEKLKEFRKENKKYNEVRPSFLKTILLREPFRSALPEKVIIIGARFPEETENIKEEKSKEEIDLSSSTLNIELHLEESIFESDVKLQKVNSSKSIYLNGSEFHKRLEASNARIQGDLILSNTKFILDEFYLNDLKNQEDDDVSIINLNGAEVKGFIKFSGTEMKLSPDLNKIPDFSDKNLYALRLLTSKVGNSIWLQGANFFGNDKKILKDNTWKLGLTAVQVADAVLIDEETKFQELDLTNSRLKSFIFMPKIANEQLSDEDTSTPSHFEKFFTLPNLFKSFLLNEVLKDSNVSTPNFVEVILSSVGEIEFQDAAVKNFQVFPKKKSSENDSVENTSEKQEVGDESTKSILKEQEAELGDESEEQGNNPENSTDSCPLKLDGLRYEKINKDGFKLIEFCLNIAYDRAHDKITQGEQQGEQEQKTKQQMVNDYNQLLQPFEQAAKAARDEGQYSLERKLLYKRKRLEKSIALQSSMLPETISLFLGDWFYGFGYRRWRGLVIFFIFWLIGCIAANYQLKKKQKRLANDAWSIRELEVKYFLERENHTDNLKEFKSIFLSEKSIRKILFIGTVESTKSWYEKIAENLACKIMQNSFPEMFEIEKSAYIVFEDETYCHFNLNPYCSLKQTSNQRFNSSKEEFENVLRLLEIKNPDVPKFGFCKDVLPGKDIWIVKDADKRSSKDYRLYDLSSGRLYGRHVGLKNIGPTFLYSLDILIPIINLDTNLRDFVFNESKGITRAYFLLQRFAAGVLGAILIPVLFIAGL